MVKNPRKSSIFGCGGGGARSFFRGGRGSFFRGGRLHFREKKKSLFSRKNVRRLLCWYSGCAGAMRQVQNKKIIFSPLGRALAPRRRGTCVFFSVLEPQGGPKGWKNGKFHEKSISPQPFPGFILDLPGYSTVVLSMSLGFLWLQRARAAPWPP